MPRERIVERLCRELMGYGVLGQNERIPERPSFRYLIGQLYPAGVDQAAADQQMQLGSDASDVEIDTTDEERQPQEPSPLMRRASLRTGTILMQERIKTMTRPAFLIPSYLSR